MARYYGTMDGRGKRITATGTDATGIAAEVMTRAGTVAVHLWTDRDGNERFDITVGEHADNGGGTIHVLAEGHFGELVAACRDVRENRRNARNAVIAQTESDALALDIAADADPVALDADGLPLEVGE